MSLWLFQDSSYNNYVTYIDSTTPGTFGIVKSDVTGTPILWSYTQTTGNTSMANIVGTVDYAGIVYVAYQYTEPTTNTQRIAIHAVSIATSTERWMKSYLLNTTAGNYITPSLTVVGEILILSCAGGVAGDVEILRLNRDTGDTVWLRTLTSTTGTAYYPVTTVSPGDGIVTNVFMTDPCAGVVTQLTGDTATVQWSRTFPAPPTPVVCFLAGAPVRMANGSWKPIEQIEAGDRVWSHKGARTVLERVETHTLPHEKTNPFIFPVGFMGATATFGISPTHKVFCRKGGAAVYPRGLGLFQLPMVHPWTYYNIKLSGWEHICIAGIVVESCAPTSRVRVPISTYNSLMVNRHRGKKVSEQEAIRILTDNKTNKDIFEINMAPAELNQDTF